VAADPSRSAPSSTVRLAAVGDLLLLDDPTVPDRPRDVAALLAPVRHLWADCDLVLGNLECTLPGRGDTVPTEPRVITTPDALRGLRAAGFDVVSLGNNHAFDAGLDGFLQVRDLLRNLGVACFGAGTTLDEAAAPAILTVRDTRVAFLGAVDARSGAGRFAAPDRWGVAPLDLPRLLDQVRDLRRRIDHVVVSVHWGEERFLIPSPEQIAQARALLDAGAVFIHGHHPHVLQGIESHPRGLIAYSLGNFAAAEVPFTDGTRIHWNRTERTGCVLTVDLAPDANPTHSATTTYDDSHAVLPDPTDVGRRRLARASRALARGISLARYRRHHLWVKTLRPALAFLRGARLKTLRPRHIARALASLLRAFRAR